MQKHKETTTLSNPHLNFIISSATVLTGFPLLQLTLFPFQGVNIQSQNGAISTIKDPQEQQQDGEGNGTLFLRTRETADLAPRAVLSPSPHHTHSNTSLLNCFCRFPRNSPIICLLSPFLCSRKWATPTGVSGTNPRSIRYWTPFSGFLRRNDRAKV